MLWHPVFGFDPDLYSQAFKERFLAVYAAVSVMSFLYAFLYASTEMELINMNEYLRGIADVDELTKLPNRRRMQDILYQEISRFRRTEHPFCIAMVDIDHFKSVNDTYGHECGDLIILKVAEKIKNILRAQDVCARWGGEEYLILLPETNLVPGEKIAERLRIAIQEMTVDYEKQKIAVTASFGIQEFRKKDNLMDCLREADKKLYRAKADGRNRIVI
jgi:diguanylate cyclase (GGDEF)-like protein